MKRHTSSLTLFIFLLAANLGPVLAQWNQIGLAGVDVTAITTGINAWSGEPSPVLFLGTETGDVLMMNESKNIFEKYPKITLNESDKPRGKIRALLLSKSGTDAYAGSDSGLFMQSMVFSSLPAWKKAINLVAGSVNAITCNDSIVTAATTGELYSSKSLYGGWISCNMSQWLPEISPPPNFTSLVSWHGVITAGSSLTGEKSTFGGVLVGSKNASDWTNATCINSCAHNPCVNNNVYCLATGLKGELYAGTSNGIYRLNDLDTGCWHEISPQLADGPINHLCVTYDSSINASVLFASTPGGIHILSPRIDPDNWSLSTSMKANGIVSLKPANSGVVYAATQDGLWKYEPPTSVHNRLPSKPPVPSGIPIEFYSIDGRLLRSAPGSGNKRTGVFISVQRDENGIRKELTLHSVIH